VKYLVSQFMGNPYGLQSAQAMGVNAPIPIFFAFPTKKADGRTISKTRFIIGSFCLLRFKKAG
jgi:hypothetical protein